MSVAGIDISDLSVKFIKFRQSKNIAIEFFGESSIAEGIIVNGEIKDEDKLIKVLEEMVSTEKRLRYLPVVASLPEEKSFLRLIQLPKVDRGKIENAVRWEIEANIPLSPEELWYDHEVIEPLEDHLDHVDVVVTAFPRALVESYIRVFKRAGFFTMALELESQAIVRSVIADLRVRPAEIIVDMGRTRTGIIIVSGGAIIFTTTVGLGGRILDNNISRALGVNQEKAVAIKKEQGASRRAEDGKVFSAVLPAMSVLADEIKRAVEYYVHQGPHLHGASPIINTVLLTGGDANLKGLDTYLSSALKIPTRLADPWVTIKNRLDTVVPSIPRNKALAFTTAIGLALRGIR